MQMVDSKKDQLGFEEVLDIALKNTGSDYTVETALPIIKKELYMKKSAFEQFGNTIFIVHEAGPRMCYFRALNADTASNFINNGKKFVDWVYNNAGMDVGAVDYNGDDITRVIKTIVKNPPHKGVDYKLKRLPTGETRAIVTFGPRRK